MDSIEVDSLLFGTGKDDDQIYLTNIVEGIAKSDSVDGMVYVDLKGMSVTGDGSQAVKMPTIPSVKKLDKVQVSLTGYPGKGRVPIVIGVIGGGDRTYGYVSDQMEVASKQMEDAVELAEAAAERAVNEATEIASATGQHFWANDNGVHVSNEAEVEAGSRNILMNSEGIILRYSDRWVSQFSTSAIAFYDGIGNAVSNIAAKFTSTSAQIGKTSEQHSIWDSTGMFIRKASNNLAQFSATDSGASVSFYDGSGNDSSNIVAQFTPSEIKLKGLSLKNGTGEYSSYSFLSSIRPIAVGGGPDDRNIVVGGDGNDFKFLSEGGFQSDYGPYFTVGRLGMEFWAPDITVDVDESDNYMYGGSIDAVKTASLFYGLSSGSYVISSRVGQSATAWNYVLYENGLAMCWARWNPGWSSKVDYGWNSYVTSNTTSVAYPFTFTYSPAVFVHIEDSNIIGVGVKASNSTASQLGTVYGWLPYQKTWDDSSHMMSVLAMGRWK